MGTEGQVRGDQIPVGVRFSAPVQTGPGAHPASCTMGTGSFLGVKSGRGVTLTPHPLLVPWSGKSRVIPLLPIWAVRPVQSLSACTRVHLKQRDKRPALRMTQEGLRSTHREGKVIYTSCCKHKGTDQFGTGDGVTPKHVQVTEDAVSLF